MKELLEVERMHDRIVAKEERCIWLRSIAEGTTGFMDGERVQTSGDPQKKSSAVIELVAAEAELEEWRLQYSKLQAKVIDKIATIEKALERTVLKKRYIDFQTFTQIASDLGYSCGYIRRIHRDAITNYQMIAAVE